LRLGVGRSIMSTPRYLRRDDVPAFLRDRFGITIAVSTLKDLRATGDGPEAEYFRGRPLYREDRLEAWVKAGLRPRSRNAA
jgi:hypothetical protein